MHNSIYISCIYEERICCFCESQFFLTTENVKFSSKLIYMGYISLKYDNEITKKKEIELLCYLLY